MLRNRMIFALLITAILTIGAAAQTHKASATTDKSKRPSPPAKAEATIQGKKITVDYSSPSMKGRKIYGGLVPYDKWWRTGANEATTLTTEVDLVIGNLNVPAGTYRLATIPGEKSWKLIISKEVPDWGTEDKYDATKDLGRVEMEVEKNKSPVEKFKIYFEKEKKEAGYDLVLEWENTKASVDVKAKK